MTSEKEAAASSSFLSRIPANVQFVIAVGIIYFCYGRSSFVQERMCVLRAVGGCLIDFCV